MAFENCRKSTPSVSGASAPQSHPDSLQSGRLGGFGGEAQVPFSSERACRASSSEGGEGNRAAAGEGGGRCCRKRQHLRCSNEEEVPTKKREQKHEPKKEVPSPVYMEEDDDDAVYSQPTEDEELSEYEEEAEEEKSKTGLDSTWKLLFKWVEEENSQLRKEKKQLREDISDLEWENGLLRQKIRDLKSEIKRRSEETSDVGKFVELLQKKDCELKTYLKDFREEVLQCLGRVDPFVPEPAETSGAQDLPQHSTQDSLQSSVQELAQPSVEDPPQPRLVVDSPMRKKKKKKKRSSEGAAPTPSPEAAPSEKFRATVPAPKPAKAVLPRSCRSEAIRVHPASSEGSFDPNEILSACKSAIDLKELGIDGVHYRGTLSGGLVLLLNGQDRAAKADILAERMAAVLSGWNVNITRSGATAPVSFKFYNHALSADELVAALSEASGCSRTRIRLGEIQGPEFGMAFVTARLPLDAAEKVIAARKFGVGWTVAKVVDRKQGSPKCFRCFEKGHVAGQCVGRPDRSNTCFSCGETGHRRADCNREQPAGSNHTGISITAKEEASASQAAETVQTENANASALQNANCTGVCTDTSILNCMKL